MTKAKYDKTPLYTRSKIMSEDVLNHPIGAEKSTVVNAEELFCMKFCRYANIP